MADSIEEQAAATLAAEILHTYETITRLRESAEQYVVQGQVLVERGEALHDAAASALQALRAGRVVEAQRTLSDHLPRADDAREAPQKRTRGPDRKPRQRAPKSTREDTVTVYHGDLTAWRDAICDALSMGPAARERYGDDGPTTLAGLCARTGLTPEQIAAAAQTTRLIVTWRARRPGDSEPVQLWGMRSQFFEAVQEHVKSWPDGPPSDLAREFGVSRELIEQALAATAVHHG